MENVLYKLDTVFNSFRALKFKTGEIIFRPGDPLNNIYYIKEGQVIIYSHSEKGEEVSFHIFKPGSIFPMMLILAQAANNYYAEALTDVDLRQAPADLVIDFIKKEPEVLFDLTKRFAQAICGLMVRIEGLISSSSSKKLELLLSYFVKHYGERADGGILITMPLTHSMLGSWLGLNRETVTRQMDKLQKKGLINYRDGLIIVNNSQVTLRYN